MKILLNTPGFLLVFSCLFASCTQKFYDRNGSVFRLPSEKNDKAIVSRSTFEKYTFNPDRYPFASGTEGDIKYINTVTVAELARKNEHFLLIFYDPHCPATVKRLEIAKYASEKNLPFLLISLYNDPNKIRSWNEKFGIDNAHSCILPSLSKDSMGILSKKVNLINSLHDSCRIIYRDDLRYVDYMIFADYGSRIYLDIEGYHYKQEDIIGWIDRILDSKAIN